MPAGCQSLGTAWGSGRQVSIQTEFDVYCFAHTNDFVKKHVILHVVREKKVISQVTFCTSPSALAWHLDCRATRKPQ